MNKDEKKSKEWIRLASKSRPGRFYLFNKSTGETQWLPLKQGEETEGHQKKESPPKLSIQKASKTPAQDRLKRLQNNLKLSQTKPHTSNATPPITDIKTKISTEQENELKNEPPTSSKAKGLAKSAIKAVKRSIVPNEIVINNKRLKSTVLDDSKDSCFPSSLQDNPLKVTSSKSAILKSSAETLQASTKSTTNNVLEDVRNTEDNCSTLSNIRSGIVKKIKEICKIPFNKYKNSDEKQILNGKTSSLTDTTKFKPARKRKASQSLSTAATKEFIITQIKEEKDKTPENTILTNISELNTPKSLKTPSYPRGSANLRLEKLKQSLISQQCKKPCIITNTSDVLNQKCNFLTEPKDNRTELLQTIDSPCTSHNCSINSSRSTANDTTNDEIEAMDWQPSVKDEEPSEEVNPEPTLLVEKSNKFSLKNINENANQTMGDIIDTVNENLLRYSAEKQKYSPNNNQNWHKDFYYFVVDTNVLIRDLTFVEDLSNMKLCDTKGSMLYIPYAVLQELDRLKMRFGVQEGVKTLAVRVIKYLNNKFENNSAHLSAQSALEERHHLIDINSADDSIINCCLQAKRHIPNLLLLTEDINLRNKAICNNITVSSKSDLMAKRYDKS